MSVRFVLGTSDLAMQRLTHSPSLTVDDLGSIADIEFAYGDKFRKAILFKLNL